MSLNFQVILTAECDNEHGRYSTKYQTFTGNSAEWCAQQAQRAGWIISPIRTICKTCAEKESKKSVKKKGSGISTPLESNSI